MYYSGSLPAWYLSYKLIPYLPCSNVHISEQVGATVSFKGRHAHHDSAMWASCQGLRNFGGWRRALTVFNQPAEMRSSAGITV